MKNWSVDEESYKKRDPKGYKRWRLTQLINFGLDGEKINRQELRDNWEELDIDPGKRRFLKFLLGANVNSN